MKRILAYIATITMLCTLAHLHSNHHESQKLMLNLAQQLKKYNISNKQKTIILRRTAGALALYRKELNQWARYS